MNYSLEQLKKLPTLQFKNLCAQHDIKIIGGVTPQVKNIKAKQLLSKIGESLKENVEPTYNSSTDQTDQTAQQPVILSPKKILIKSLSSSSEEDESNQLKKDAEQFFAIKVVSASPDKEKEKSGYKTPPHDNSEKNSNFISPDEYIFNSMPDALKKLTQLKNRNYTLSPKINNYQQAINYVRNVNQRNFREENFYKNPAPVKEVKLNNFPRISDYDPNTIGGYILYQKKISTSLTLRNLFRLVHVEIAANKLRRSRIIDDYKHLKK